MNPENNPFLEKTVIHTRIMHPDGSEENDEEITWELTPEGRRAEQQIGRILDEGKQSSRSDWREFAITCVFSSVIAMLVIFPLFTWRFLAVQLMADPEAKFASEVLLIVFMASSSYGVVVISRRIARSILARWDRPKEVEATQKAAQLLAQYGDNFIDALHHVGSSIPKEIEAKIQAIKSHEPQSS